MQINNGVYKSGFATSQVGYDRAQEGLYAALRHVDGLLATHRFLLGDRCLRRCSYVSTMRPLLAMLAVCLVARSRLLHIVSSLCLAQSRANTRSEQD